MYMHVTGKSGHRRGRKIEVHSCVVRREPVEPCFQHCTIILLWERIWFYNIELTQHQLLLRRTHDFFFSDNGQEMFLGCTAARVAPSFLLARHSLYH